MAQLAGSLGLPQRATMIEGRAQSTLQNALFSLRLIPKANRLILVTEAFHMPRSLASFKWAGAPNLTSAITAPISVESGRTHRWQMIPREAAAIWFNLARAITFDLTGWLGLDEEWRITMLR